MRAGFGKADITIYEPGVVMLGWAEPDNVANGAGDDLACRAMALDDGERVVVYACAELAFVTGALRDAVLHRLDAAGLDLPASAVMLTATHNHSGPSGYSHRFLYNLLEQGHRPQVLEGLASGMADAIVQAVARLEPAVVEVSAGPVGDAIAWNRAWRSYNRNRDVVPVTASTTHRAIDRTMTLLRVRSTAGRPLGAISWFGLHGTTVHADQQLIRHDHKGAASRQWEADPPEGADGFVAIFAQGPAGDVTANGRWHAERGRAVRHDDDLVGRAEVADAQVRTARRLWDQIPRFTVHRGLQAALRYVDMEHLQVDARYTAGSGPARTTEAVIGLAMALGTDEGPGPYHHRAWVARAIRRVLLARRGRSAEGGLPKVPFLQVGRGSRGRMFGMIPVTALAPFGFLDPTVQFAKDAMARGLGDAPWVPTVLPLQILRIGPFAIAGLPCEPTTVAGRRLAATVCRGIEVPMAVVNGYANDYAGYCTTAEEFDEQGYEGGCTWFGRWTCAAWRTELDRLATGLHDDGRPRRPLPFQVDALRHRPRAFGKGLGIFSARKR